MGPVSAEVSALLVIVPAIALCALGEALSSVRQHMCTAAADRLSPLCADRYGCAPRCCLCPACRNALAYILFAEGIPYIYYGTEQGYTVDREPLWHSGYSREHPLWLFLRISVAYRKEAKVSAAPLPWCAVGMCL